MAARAGLYNFIIEQGADWFDEFQYVDQDEYAIDLTDAIITFGAKSDDQATTVEVMACTSVGNDGIEITDAVNGRFAFNRVGYETEEFPAGTYLYNIEIASPTIGTIRLLQGTVTVDPDVNT